MGQQPLGNLSGSSMVPAEAWQLHGIKNGGHTATETLAYLSRSADEEDGIPSGPAGLLHVEGPNFRILSPEPVEDRRPRRWRRRH